MVWVVKLRGEFYEADRAHNLVAIQNHAFRHENRSAALRAASWWNDADRAHIVRLKPRACRSEADIRREERERIARALQPDGWAYVTLKPHSPERIKTCDELKKAILAFDWPGPEKK